MEIAKQVEQILTAVFNINKRLKGRVDMTMALGLSVSKRRWRGPGIAALSPATVSAVLAYMRYLQAIEKRLEKMAIVRTAIQARMLKVRACGRHWQQWLNKLPPNRSGTTMSGRSAG
ncbi:DUF3418 domain-containing protein [Klebsiella pneumoniae]|nr:DUF3418 domain-containing protein [Klebsiella pneumoniae]